MGIGEKPVRGIAGALAQRLAVMLNETAGTKSLIVTEPVETMPFEDVTVTVNVPTQSPIAFWVVWLSGSFHW